MNALKINIQRESPSLSDFVKKYANDQIIADIVPNALDFMRLGTVSIPVVYDAETGTYTLVKKFHVNLIYTLALWLHHEIELKDSTINDPETIKSVGYQRKMSEKYLQVDVIVKTNDNHKEVELLVNLYKQL
jgi:hypothetical protein